MAQLQARGGISMETVRQHVVCSVVSPSIPPQQVYLQVPFPARADHVHVIHCQGVPSF